MGKEIQRCKAEESLEKPIVDSSPAGLALSQSNAVCCAVRSQHTAFVQWASDNTQQIKRYCW